MSHYEQITSTVDEGVATISLARPEARNGYTVQMANELRSALRASDSDDSVRVVILTGEGRDFCVGADLSGGAFEQADDDLNAADWLEPAGRCSQQIHQMRKPVIAALRGVAVGAGATIILSCDFRLAAHDSRFGFVFTRRGIFPEGGSVWYLPRLVGMGTALDWMLTGRVFDADEALSAGLVRSLHAPDEVYDAALQLAREIATHAAPTSSAVIRQMLRHLAGLESPAQAHRIDSRLIAGIATHPDAVEGVASFLERRPAQFPMSPSESPGWLPWNAE